MSKVSLFRLITNADNTTSFVQSDKSLIVLTDHRGNIFLKCDSTYYVLFTEWSNPAGAYVVKVPKIDVFRNNYNNSKYASKSKRVIGGTVKATGETLKGKVSTKLNDMPEDEKEEFTDTHEYTIQPTVSGESNYYWVNRDKTVHPDSDNSDNSYDSDNSDNPDDSDDDTETFNAGGFYLDSVCHSETDESGIVLSDLLCEFDCSFKTILVAGDLLSHNIKSVIQQKNGFSSQDVTIYTTGFIKTHFVDAQKICRLCIDDNNIISTYEVLKK